MAKKRARSAAAGAGATIQSMSETIVSAAIRAAQTAGTIGRNAMKGAARTVRRGAAATAGTARRAVHRAAPRGRARRRRAS